MTREEAIKYAESKKMILESLIYNDDCRYGNYAMYSAELSFVNAVISALTPPTQEQLERVLGGSWQGSADGYADGELVYDMWKCSGCGHEIDEEDGPDMLPDFCPKCGAANTDKAREIIRKRLEELNDEKGD